jgi:acetyl-CoA carboxylase biotin carboxyl carrier protein
VSLTAADVAEILRLLEQSSFDELNLEINGMKLSLKRGASAGASGAGSRTVPDTAASMTTATSSAADFGAAASASPNPAATNGAPARATDPNIHDVPSPLLGTFYRSPKPGAPPFVEVGSPVSEETIVGIIEVMKLMNTVRAGARGTVTEILSADGALVEYDQPILRVRKSG